MLTTLHFSKLRMVGGDSYKIRVNIIALCMEIKKGCQSLLVAQKFGRKKKLPKKKRQKKIYTHIDGNGPLNFFRHIVGYSLYVSTRDPIKH